MQKQIQINNFRRDKQSLELKDLGKVNYLVGENNSGKSTILDVIHYSFLKENLADIALFEKMSGKIYPFQEASLEANFKVKNLVYLASSFSANLFGKELDAQVLNSKFDYYLWMGNQNFQSTDKLAADKISLVVLEFGNWIEENLSEEKYLIEYLKKPYFWHDYAVDDPSGILGFKFLLRFFEEVYTKYRHHQTLILIEQIEGCFHPKWEKLLPKFFDLVGQKMDLHFLISTHSPFVISASGELTDLQKFVATTLKQEFEPSQKVYLIKNGRTISKSGREGGGNYGYWGGKANFVASNILGAGLADMYKRVNRKPDENSPILVFCEGQSKDEDAKFYNRIFADYYRPVMFVSAQGSSTVETSFKLLQEIKSGLYANFEILMLRDRDHHYPNIEDIKSEILVKPEKRILLKRAIELYIYNEETVEDWFASISLKLPNSLRVEILNAHRKIEKSVEKGIQGFDYKGLLVGEVFKKKIYPYYQNYFKSNYRQKSPVPFEKLDDELVKFITSKTHTYKELEKVIFKGV